MKGQVLHQPQVKRQLFGGQPLKQSQHQRRHIGGDKVVGVLNAARAALHFLQVTELEGLKESVGLVERDLCVDRHV